MIIRNSTNLVIASALVVSACAKDPDSIAAVQMEDAAYARYSCSQLEQEELRQSQILRALYADQESAQSGDALGVFLLGLPVSSMAGADKETEIAVTKGRLDALDRQQAAKRCPATSVVAASQGRTPAPNRSPAASPASATGSATVAVTCDRRRLTAAEFFILRGSKKGNKLINTRNLNEGSMVDPAWLVGVVPEDALGRANAAGCPR